MKRQIRDSLIVIAFEFILFLTSMAVAELLILYDTNIGSVIKWLLFNKGICYMVVAASEFFFMCGMMRNLIQFSNTIWKGEKMSKLAMAITWVFIGYMITDIVCCSVFKVTIYDVAVMLAESIVIAKYAYKTAQKDVRHKDNQYCTIMR